MPIMSRAEAMMCRSAPWRSFAKWVVLPWVLAGEGLSGQILEIGGGSGATTQTILRGHAGIDLTLTDVDPAMVAAAERRLAPYGDRAHVQVADATNLPFDDGSFDTVLSFIMLHHVIDWQDALNDAARVLKPGGRLLGYDLTRTRWATAFHRLDRSPAALVSSDHFRTGLEAAGLAPIALQTRLRESVMRFEALRR